MRKTLVFRLVALKLFVISAVSLGCGDEVANAAFDEDAPFSATRSQALLVRVEAYARLIRSWQVGLQVYTSEPSQPLAVYRLHNSPFRLSDKLVQIADKVSQEQPFRFTDAVSTLLSEMASIRAMQQNRMGDTLDAFAGPESLDRLIGDGPYLHRLIQALLAARVIQKQIEAIETVGEAVAPEKKMSQLSPDEISTIRARLSELSYQNLKFQLLDSSVPHPEPSSLFGRLAKFSFQFNGSHVGFQRILLRYMVLKKRLGIAEVEGFNLLLNHIDCAREHCASAKPDLVYPWSDFPLLN